MIDFPETIEESVLNLKKALPKLVEHKLPTNPLNYAVWYTYVSERIPELNFSIDQLIATESGYSTLHASALFHRYVLIDGDKRKATEQLTVIAEAASRHITNSLRCTESLDMHIRASGKALQSAQQHTDVIQIVEDATTAFELLRFENSSVEERLKDTQRELEAMKVELNRVQRSSDLDPLTKLSNRAAMDRELCKLIGNITEGQQLSFIMCDIDHFKRFNDHYGHLMGDRVLQRVGTLLLSHVRTSNLAARYGGEEFVIAAPDTALDEAVAIAERLRDRIEHLRVKVRGTEKVLDNITASFGVSTYRTGDSVESLFDRADMAMYAAKASGRNAVRTEHQAELEQSPRYYPPT